MDKFIGSYCPIISAGGSFFPLKKVLAFITRNVMDVPEERKKLPWAITKSNEDALIQLSSPLKYFRSKKPLNIYH